MKKSKKQRKIETAKRVAKELAAKQNKVLSVSSVQIKQEQPEIIPENYIVKAAIYVADNDKVYSYGDYSGHSDIRTFYKINEYNPEFKNKTYIEGFLDNKGNFLNRYDAAQLAKQSGQLKYDNQESCLYSYGFRHI